MKTSLSPSKLVCGLDEVGRGALAGPLVAAAVILTKNIKGLKDSKKLTLLKRQLLYKKIIKNSALAIIEEISALMINRKGMGWANKEIFRRLILKAQANKYIVDGNLKIKVRGKSKKIKSLIKADSVIPEVMAASIIAKVTRDKIMRELSVKFKIYGWQLNIGYGTKFHIQAIREYGLTRHHRKLFVKTVLKGKSSAIWLLKGAPQGCHLSK